MKSHVQAKSEYPPAIVMYGGQVETRKSKWFDSLAILSKVEG